MKLSELSLPVRRSMDGEDWQCLLFRLSLATIPKGLLAGRPTAYSALPCTPGISEYGGDRSLVFSDSTLGYETYIL